MNAKHAVLPAMLNANDGAQLTRKIYIPPKI